MSVRKPAVLKKSRLSAAMLAAILMPAAASALAQDTEESSSQEATNLEKVVVTGSLIPQTELETFVPVTIITAEDIKARYSKLFKV